MKNKTFKITGNVLTTVGSKGKEQYMIKEISKNEIVIEAQAENGVDIVEYISWDQIK
jgi:hypothetical protein